MPSTTRRCTGSVVAACLRATTRGLALPAVALAGTLALAPLPAAAAGGAAGGFAVAAVALLLGNLALAQVLADPRPKSGGRLFAVVGVDLGLLVVLGAGSLVALFSVAAKFAAAVAFACAFVATAIVARVVGAVVLSRTFSAAGLGEPRRADSGT